jgi:hypothetical protein
MLVRRNEVKTNVYVLKAHGGATLYSKLFIVAVILALISAFLPMASALAAPARVLETDDLARRQATRVVSTRAGFDINGKVTNDKQALQSVSDLAENLRIMRAIWLKLDEGGYELHRMK